MTTYFEQAQHSVLRLENRSHTNIPDEQPRIAAFLAGEQPEEDWAPQRWLDMLAAHRAAGRPFRRARIMEDPPTVYNRYMTFHAARNIAVGDDVRFLARADANALDLPDHDFWVFDEQRVIELHFTHDGRPLEHFLLTDPDAVAAHTEWVHRAWAAATPLADYLAEDPTRAWPPARVAAEAR